MMAPALLRLDELRGHLQRDAQVRSPLMGHRRALAPTFRAGRDAALYPFARRRRAPTGTRSVSRQTRSRRLPADVADFVLANCGSADDGAGAAAARRATGSSTTRCPSPQPTDGSPPCSRSDISGWT